MYLTITTVPNIIIEYKDTVLIMFISTTFDITFFKQNTKIIAISSI